MRTPRMTTARAAIVTAWVAGQGQIVHVRPLLPSGGCSVISTRILAALQQSTPACDWSPCACSVHGSLHMPWQETGFRRHNRSNGCSHSSLQPQAGEMKKRMGCFCGGVAGDMFSEYACDTMQPWTNWLVELHASANATDLADGSPFNASIYERAGTPSNVRKQRPLHCRSNPQPLHCRSFPQQHPQCLCVALITPTCSCILA